MIVTLYDSYNCDELILMGRNDEFQEAVDNLVRKRPDMITDIRKHRIYFRKKDTFRVLSDLADYVNNFIGDEFLIEVD